MNIVEVLQRSAKTGGDVPAIVERGRTVTFAELDRMGCHVAAQLERSGLRPGDRAAVFCPMSIALYAVLIGLWRAGGVAVFVDPSARRDRIESCCGIARPRVFIGIPRAHLLRLAVPSLRQVACSFSIGRPAPLARTLLMNAVGISHPIAAVDPSSPALITFTSGATGTPKAAVRSHGFLLAQHRALAGELDLHQGQRDFATLPIFVLANLASGITTIIPNLDLRRPDQTCLSALATDICDTRPTRLAASPALVARLVDADGLRPDLMATFERIDIGGGPVFPELLRQVATAAPAAAVAAVYGSTEAEPIARLRSSDTTNADINAMAAGAGLLAGEPVPTIDLRIITDRWGQPLGPYGDDAFEREVLPPGTVGEIVVSGNHVLSTYLDGQGDTAIKIRVGDRVWHRTGDAGYVDARGRLWLLGRCSAKARDRHGTLYPFAVECAAQSIAGVKRCALLAGEGRRLLIVEPCSDAPGDITHTVRAHLAWACLDDVLAVPRLPVDERHNAKIDYSALAQLAAGRVRADAIARSKAFE